MGVKYKDWVHIEHVTNFYTFQEFQQQPDGQKLNVVATKPKRKCLLCDIRDHQMNEKLLSCKAKECNVRGKLFSCTQNDRFKLKIRNQHCCGVNAGQSNLQRFSRILDEYVQKEKSGAEFLEEMSKIYNENDLPTSRQVSSAMYYRKTKRLKQNQDSSVTESALPSILPPPILTPPVGGAAACSSRAHYHHEVPPRLQIQATPARLPQPLNCTNEQAPEPTTIRDNYQLATKLIHANSNVVDGYDASGPPIYQTATFKQDNATECGPYDYTRSGNPTRDQLQQQWADIEGAHSAVAYASGMAAIVAIMRLIPPATGLLVGTDIYGGTSRLLAQVIERSGVAVRYVDMMDLEATKKVLSHGGIGLVLLETPTNPRMQVLDILAVVEMSHQHGALVAVDNSILTCLYQRPLDLGADISMTSATKFVAGHGDATGGLVAARDPAICRSLAFTSNAEGNMLAPFECWLMLRGLKTMSVRMNAAIMTCSLLVRVLICHKRVKCVNWPGLAGNQGDIQAKQARSPGSLVSFTTGSLEASRHIVESARLFKITVSFGSVTSLISLPCYMSHASIPADVRAARGLPDDLVRLSVGVEDAGDLALDLTRVLDEALMKYGPAEGKVEQYVRE